MILLIMKASYIPGARGEVIFFELLLLKITKQLFKCKRIIKKLLTMESGYAVKYTNRKTINSYIVFNELC